MATAIVILNYNTATETISCIRSIETYNTAPVKFIIVDNGSSDKNEVKRLDDFFINSQKSYLKFTDAGTPRQTSLPYYSFIASSYNDGYARGNNKGLIFAFSDSSIQSILILNSDVLFSEDIIPTLVRFQDSMASCGLISPLVISRTGTIDHCCARKAPTNWEVILSFLFFQRDLFHYISRVDYRQKILKDRPQLVNQAFFPIDIPSGACMLINKDIFQSFGGFDPHTFLYHEENILEKKTKKAGLINYCIPSVKCIHLGAGSTTQMSSIFLQKCNLDSADFYLKEFCNMSVLQSFVWSIARTMWRLKFILKKTSRQGTHKRL